MKKFLKQNKTFIIILSLLIVWVVICTLQYREYLNETQLSYDEMVDLCEHSAEYKNETKLCSEYIKGTSLTPNAIVIFFYIINNYSINYLQWFGSLIVIFAVISSIHSELHSEFIKYKLQREPYKVYLKKLILTSLKNATILPIIFIVLFILSCVLSGNLDFNDTSKLMIAKNLTSNLPYLMVTYILVIFLHSIFYCNLALICIKKNKSRLVATISGYLLFIVLDIILEIIIGGFIFKALNLTKYSGLLSLLGIYIYYDIPNLSLLIIYSIFLVISSFIILLNTYKNEEEVLISLEG